MTRMEAGLKIRILSSKHQCMLPNNVSPDPSPSNEADNYPQNDADNQGNQPQRDGEVPNLSRPSSQASTVNLERQEDSDTPEADDGGGNNDPPGPGDDPSSTHSPFERVMINKGLKITLLNFEPYQRTVLPAKLNSITMFENAKDDQDNIYMIKLPPRNLSFYQLFIYSKSTTASVPFATFQQEPHTMAKERLYMLSFIELVIKGKGYTCPLCFYSEDPIKFKCLDAFTLHIKMHQPYQMQKNNAVNRSPPQLDLRNRTDEAVAILNIIKVLKIAPISFMKSPPPVLRQQTFEEVSACCHFINYV